MTVRQVIGVGMVASGGFDLVAAGAVYRLEERPTAALARALGWAALHLTAAYLLLTSYDRGKK